MAVVIDGQGLSLEDVVQAARHGVRVELASEAQENIERSRALVEKIVAAGKTVYGINTGFGKLSNVSIPDDELDQLQENLILSHSAGVGPLFAEEEVRAMLLLRANTLAMGHSGVRPVIVEVLLQMLNQGVHPAVPQKGSVGASGDLVPLSHLALVMLGRGEAFYQGERLPGGVAMERAGIKPVVLKAKEGLALCNGTQAMTGVGALAVYDAICLAKSADIIGAMTVEALEGIVAAFDEKVHKVRPHRGQMETAANLRRLLDGSEILEASRYDRVQDAYTLRCMPQVHGASKDAIRYVRSVVETEINSVTDNPLIFAEEEQVISGGNFHGQPVALVMDFLGIAVAELASLAERRIERMVNPALNAGLPAFLVENGGINNGLMIAQYTAAALVSENKVLAHPASVDSIPTSANQEDHVSMGTIAARKAREILNNARQVLAIELLCACQGLEFRKRKPAGKTERVYKMVRSRVAKIERDRVIAQDIREIEQLLLAERLLEVLTQE
jgi:histidine ammonia-lyase